MTTTETAKTEPKNRRSTKIGQVVSTKMNKTAVVEVRMRKSHALYKRVVSHSKKFYAHDETNNVHVGDTVEIEETRPLSKLKRWRIKRVLQRAKLVGAEEPQSQPTAG